MSQPHLYIVRNDNPETAELRKKAIGHLAKRPSGEMFIVDRKRMVAYHEVMRAIADQTPKGETYLRMIQPELDTAPEIAKKKVKHPILDWLSYHWKKFIHPSIDINDF